MWARRFGTIRRLANGLGAPIVALAVALTATAQQPAQTQEGSVDELAGLWKAHRSFGPNARGPLVIRRAASTYTAEMLGRTLPVRLDRGELSFELPDGAVFRGKLESDGSISGHWFPPRSPTGFDRASPVTLRAEGPGLWRGRVVPAEDTFTFYILAQKQPDGSMGAFLRNPQRDMGAIWGADRLVRDGNTIRLLGKRPRQTEESEVAAGIYRAKDSVLTLDFPARGGLFEFRREGDASDFYPRGKNPARYVYGGAPPARDDGWKTGTLQEVGIDRATIEKYIQGIIDTPMESTHSPQIDGVLIARHGKLVLEEYFHGQNRDKLHETRSASKSMTATIIGAAMYAGAPITMTTPVYQIMNGGTFPPGLDPRKRAMTLEHLITMSSGYFCDDSNADAPGNENTMQNQTAEPDYYRFTLNLPMAYAPGEKAIYCSINPNLALGLVGRATGESPLYTFDRLVAGPLKIRRYGWFMDPVGHPYGGGGVHFLPRDFVKIGQLMLDGGTWEGRRILSREFVAKASSPLYPLGTMGYGYAWWGIDYPYGNRTVHAFAALGAGGQDVIVVPDLDLVVAVYASNFGDRISMAFQRETMPKEILPAVTETANHRTPRQP
jgi:CubicO group peptidase (beta-lactamase class C family)